MKMKWVWENLGRYIIRATLLIDFLWIDAISILSLKISLRSIPGMITWCRIPGASNCGMLKDVPLSFL